MGKPRKRCEGFTLIEIMVVIAIIAILAAIAIPQFSAYRDKSKIAAAQSALRNLAVAQENYYYYNNCYTLNRGLLTTLNGWTAESEVSVIILAASTTSWSATARHTTSSTSVNYSSGEGGIQ